MPRPTNPGLDYSQIDVSYARKSLSLRIRQKFGMLGHVMLYEVIAWINEGKGCYAEYNEDTPAQFATTRLFDLSMTDRVKEVFDFMLDCGFFDRACFERDKILTSPGIVNRYLQAKRRVYLDDLPDSVKELAGEFWQNNVAKTPVSSAKTTVSSAKTPENDAKRELKKRKEKNIYQTNKQASEKIVLATGSDTPDFSPSGSETLGEKSHAAPPFAVLQNLAEDTEPPAVFAAAREAVLNTCYFRGISRGLVDAAAWCVAEGWITERGLRNIRRKADAKVELFRDTQGRRGHEEGWEVVRECVALVIREHGYEPPEYSRLDPEPPPAKPAKAERMTAGC